MTTNTMIENFCETCRIQYKNARGYKYHLQIGKNHKKPNYTTDRELSIFERQKREKMFAA